MPNFSQYRAADSSASRSDRSEPAETQAAPSLIQNTAFNAAASLVSLGIGFVLSPILLAALGLERFGLWSLLWAIAGSLGLVDLHIVAAMTPLIAAARAREEHGRVTRLVRTALAFYLSLGLMEVSGAFVAVQVPAVAAWFPEPIREEGRLALVGAVMVFALNSITAVFTSTLHALQRFDLSARITIAFTVSRGITLVAVAWNGGGLRELFLAEGVLASLQCLVTARVGRRLQPGCGLLGAPDLMSMRELVVFGGKLQVAHAGHLVNLHVDKLLLSAFLGLRAVAYYELGQKIAYTMRGIPLLLISAITPVVSTLEAKGDRERLWQFHLTCMRIVVFVATPLLVFTVTGARHILIAWAGVTALETHYAVWLLALGSYLYLVGISTGVALVGMRKPGLEMNRNIIVGIMNILGSAILIPLLGFPGAPLGTVVALAVGAWYLTRAFSSEFGRPLDVIGVIRRPAAMAIPAAAGAIVILWLIQGGRGIAVLGLIGSALFIGTAYLWLGIYDKIFTREWLRSVPFRLKARTTKA